MPLFRRRMDDPARADTSFRRCSGIKLTMERICVVILLIFYLGFFLWTWRLAPPPSDSPRIDIGGSTLSAPPTRKQLSLNKNPLEFLSSVDFYACCGLGHRLVRMSLAAYVARQRNFTLRNFWGWCGERHPVEVFSYLFRPYHSSEVAHVQSRNQVLPFYNEVPGFPALVRKGPNDRCPCVADKIDSDLELYRSLRTRFRESQRVNDFVQKFFVNATVLGIHVRSGNGESGDFEQKGREIADPVLWVHHIRHLLEETFLSRPLEKSPLIFLATDTPSMVARFRSEFAPINVPVFDLPQEGRREDGAGVLFGTSDKVYNTADNHNHNDDYSSCLQGWSDTVTDMLLLSHADVVIAGRPSSFVQTLPMSIAFGKPMHARALKDVYCEIIPQYREASNLTEGNAEWIETEPIIQCYDTYENWCCNHSTWIKFHHTGPKGHAKVISKEFVRFPRLEDAGIIIDYKGMRNRSNYCRQPKRGRAGGGWKDKCLPHEWSTS